MKNVFFDSIVTNRLATIQLNITLEVKRELNAGMGSAESIMLDLFSTTVD